jgi:hypothetical protein
VKVLKEAAKTRKVPAPEVLSALSNIKKAKLDTSTFFETLGGTESPGRTWMLIFTAKVRIPSRAWPEFYYQGNEITKFQHQRKKTATGVSAVPK